MAQILPLSWIRVAGFDVFSGLGLPVLRFFWIRVAGFRLSWIRVAGFDAFLDQGCWTPECCWFYAFLD